ncbi:hypothetical protein HRD49_27185 [Corallococcus exiguus]|uniref:hypothetical protein n=1 Tax=Corallococcus exiguus TaxID=83462 RepID=UPI00155FB311|nr:hypothetical protein [Corallococcus exiguus]NRD65444.1 hypothetical protein [Corallococcus exiguus]
MENVAECSHPGCPFLLIKDDLGMNVVQSKRTRTMQTRSLVSTTLTDGRPQIFLTKANGAIVSTWKTGDSDSSWVPWQSYSVAPPRTTIRAAAKLSNGAPQLFGLTDMPGPPGPQLASGWKVSSDANASWSNWVGMGYSHASDVAAGTLQDGRLQFFVIQDGIKSQWKMSTTNPGAAYSGISNMTPTGVPGPFGLFVIELSDHRLQLIGLTSDGLVTTWKENDNPNAGWSQWQWFPNTPQTNNSVGVAWAPLPDPAPLRRPQLWSFNRFGDVHTCWKETTNPNAGWTTWTSFPAPGKVVALTATSLQDGRIQLFALDDANRIFTSWKVTRHPNAGWLDWQPFPSA